MEEEKDSPQATMPDIERDPVVSSHWPKGLPSYTREKKLIKNVSNRVEKYSRVGRAIQISRVTYDRD